MGPVKLIQTHETAPLFLYNHIKLATYSLHSLSKELLSKRNLTPGSGDNMHDMTLKTGSITPLPASSSTNSIFKQALDPPLYN